MNTEFKNKTVVITGAAQGIGEGIAIRFAKAGANLVIGDYSDKITATADRIRAEYGVNVIPFKVDVTNEEQVVALYLSLIHISEPTRRS